MRRVVIQRVFLSLAVAGLLTIAGLAAWQLYHRPSLPPLYSRANLLVNPGFQQDADGDGRPDGWEVGPAAELSDWTIKPDPGGHSLRLTGSASYVRSTPVLAWSGKEYSLGLQALTDADSPSRLQAVFLWQDTRGEVIVRQNAPWQEVPARSWETLSFEAQAPAEATSLSVLLRPAGDEPVYLDDLCLTEDGVRLEPYPGGARAALAFTLDWETAMGGLVHSRSDDSYDPTTAVQRGLAMRQGTENLLALLERYDVRATWYASGYSLLDGNPTGEAFSGDPTYSWASAANGWRNDRWTTTPWFADDPHGTVQSDPAWYFGDLVPRLLASNQDVQSHTFGHLDAGYASPEELGADLRQWNSSAARAGLTPARTLAFPWGASLGMADAGYSVLEELGYTAVTRTYHEPHGRSQYWILPPDDLLHMRTVPGHPALWAFPDYYFQGRPEDIAWAKEVIDRLLLEGGETSLWAHTEEIVSTEQQAAWDEILAYAASRRDQGLWIAPLTEIVGYRNALAQVEVRAEAKGQQLSITVVNHNDHPVSGLTLTLPAPAGQVLLGDAAYSDYTEDQLRLPALQAGQQVRLSVTVQAWEENR